MTAGAFRYRRPTPTDKRRITALTVVGAIGRVLVAFGVLVLLFVAYLLWGTGLFEAQHQSALRQELCRELRSAQVCGTKSPPAKASSSTTTTTTQPTSGVQPAQAAAVPAEGQPVGILVIPKIGVNKVIVEGTSTDDLRLGPGHYPGTPLPGQPGNSAIAGHRTTYGAPFYDLNELSPGDQIFITTPQGRFLYEVTQQLLVSPSDISVVSATTTPELTLTTCNPRFSASQRLVVHAVLQQPPATLQQPAAPAPLPTTRRTTVRAAGLAGGEGGWGGAAAWGAGCLALAILIWLIARRTRRRWVTYAIGVLPFLLLLFFFFANVSPLLPASF